MQRISISELREVSQPASITGRSNAEHWTADLYLRRISPYLTRALIATRISPNGVTWLMIITGISTGLALLIPGYKGILLALFLSQLQMLWDCCDGELARWKKKFSPAGIFLDTIGHYSAEATIVLVLGLRAANWPAAPLNESNFPFFGALLAIIVILNKVLNDAVHVAKFFTGGTRNKDNREIGQPKNSLLSKVRSIARFFPLHRIFHSVEMTIVISLVSAIGHLTNQENSLQLLINWILPISVFILIGHLIAILSSRKLIAS